MSAAAAAARDGQPMTDTSPNSDQPAGPLFKRARYRPWRRPDAETIDLPPLDPDEPYDLDEFGRPIYDDEADGEVDEGGRTWTANRTLMIILVLIVLITLLAYDLQGVFVPPAPTPPPPIGQPLI